MYKDCIGKPLILLMPHGIKSASLALRLPNAQMYKYGFLIVDFIYSVVFCFFFSERQSSESDALSFEYFPEHEETCLAGHKLP